ncbi:MAG: DUF4129 domain-containing protein [Chloroflexota bacterium]
MATAGIASADTVDLAAYRSRLRDARTLLLQARVAALAQRAPIIERARTTLSQTTAVRTADGSIIVLDESRVVRRLSETTAAIDASVADIDQLIAIADRAISPPFNVAQADAQLRELAAAEETRSGGNDLFSAIGEILRRLLPSPNASLPSGSVEITLTIAGAALLVVILAILVRGVRERIRRETVLAAAHTQAAASAAVQLAAAEHAAVTGDPRAALHAFYRYAILTLAERRMLRYEPSLTDRELLERASSLPQVETLRELISLHDRAWFGLKGATTEEADHARDLAERAVA